MELLSASGLTLEVAGHALLSGAELRLAAGDRVGLVGPNGSGKSTFLRALAGELAPSEGSVRRAPGVRVVLLPQADSALPGATVGAVARAATRHASELEARLRLEERRLAAGEERGDAYDALLAAFERAGGWAAASRVREVMAALGFTTEDMPREVATLSAGERRRLALAVALTQGADVLLLDEPTNHLDLAAREWLTRRLNAEEGAVVIVSHDRALLDAVTGCTVFLAAGRLWPEQGPYSTARARREGALVASRKRSRELEREAERLARMAQELAAYGQKAAARKRRAERQSRALRALAGAPGREARKPAPGPPTLVVRQAGKATGSEALLDARRLSVAGVLQDTNVRLARGDRVALVGPSGSGKSTLARLLAGDLRGAGPLAEVRYLPGLKLRLVDQVDRGLEPGRPLLGQVAEVVGGPAARKLLSEAGVPQRAWERPAELASGGERARAGLALAFARGGDLWILDEPTNDLDLDAIEAFEAQLEGALDESGAALVLITHDRRLAERLTREVWALEAGRLTRYTDVASYLRGERLAEPALPPGAEAASAPEAATPVAADEEGELRLLEDERTALLASLANSPTLTERDRRRAKRRLHELEEELMRRHDAKLPPPEPRYQVREHGLPVSGDVADGGLELALPADRSSARLVATRTGVVAHLRLVEPPGACLLPRARSALLDAGVRLAFTVLGANAVQVQTAEPFDSRWLRPAPDGWYTATMGEFLEVEGWRPAKSRARKEVRA